jgi:ubiquinone/menaquinone biosynthesis C-methylase UbiE
VNATPSRNEAVRSFWEQEACGTGARVTGGLEPGSAAWFGEIERNRYVNEPMIHALAQFTRHRGKRLLEIGVGAGTDHLQWARAGCRCHGVDLTDTAIEITRRHLALHGLSSELQRVDAERLPFHDASFDLVWSWGVVHHADRPNSVITEIHRVLAPGGEFRGMMYKRRSLGVAKEWLKHALLAGRPWRSVADVLAHHFESPGTKAYTPAELRAMFAPFREITIEPAVTPYDVARLPRALVPWIPGVLGMFLLIRAVK